LINEKKIFLHDSLQSLIVIKRTSENIYCSTFFTNQYVSTPFHQSFKENSENLNNEQQCRNDHTQSRI